MAIFFKIPVWPDEPFNLEAIPEGWQLGPFNKDDWDVGPKNVLTQMPDGARPTVLRVRGQSGTGMHSILHANNGDREKKDWRIVPITEP